LFSLESRVSSAQTFNDNAALAMSVVKAIESTDMVKQTIKQAADTFSECAKIVVKALDEVQSIHPFIGGRRTMPFRKYIKY